MFGVYPPSTWWLEGPRTQGKCWDDKIVLGMDIAASIINCFGDWVLGILPIFIVKSLNMRRRTKILVGCLLSFAAVGSAATFVRIFYLPNLLHGDDFLFYSTEVAYLSTIESGVGMTAVSLGTLKPLVEQWHGRRGTSAASNPNQPPRSLRRRADAQHIEYISAHGSDRASRPISRSESIFHLSKSAGPSILNSVSSNSQPEEHNMFAATDMNMPAAGANESVIMAQSLRVPSPTRNSTGLSMPLPSPVVLPSQVWVIFQALMSRWSSGQQFMLGFDFVA
ncbi:integral membrane protein [Seiridium cupressi]